MVETINPEDAEQHGEETGLDGDVASEDALSGGDENLVSEGDVVFSDPADLPPEMHNLWKGLQDKYADAVRMSTATLETLQQRILDLEAGSSNSRVRS